MSRAWPRRGNERVCTVLECRRMNTVRNRNRQSDLAMLECALRSNRELKERPLSFSNSRLTAA